MEAESLAVYFLLRLPFVVHGMRRQEGARIETTFLERKQLTELCTAVLHLNGL